MNKQQLLDRIQQLLLIRIHNLCTKKYKRRYKVRIVPQKRLAPSPSQETDIIVDYYQLPVEQVIEKYNTSHGRINRIIHPTLITTNTPLKEIAGHPGIRVMPFRIANRLTRNEGKVITLRER